MRYKMCSHQQHFLLFNLCNYYSLGSVWTAWEWNERQQCELWSSDEKLPGVDRTETHSTQDTDLLWRGDALSICMFWKLHLPLI